MLIIIIESESGDKSNATLKWGSQKIRFAKKGSRSSRFRKKGVREAKSLGASVFDDYETAPSHIFHSKG